MEKKFTKKCEHCLGMEIVTNPEEYKKEQETTVTRVYGFSTGNVIPEGAIYLNSLSYKLYSETSITHYFLVKEEE